jgi:hypothetical protein
MNSKCRSHIATDCQSVCLSWWSSWPDISTPSGAHELILTLVRQLLPCPCGASSLTRRRVRGLSDSQLEIIRVSQLSVCTIYLHFTGYKKYVYAVCARPLSVQAQYSRSCPIFSRFRCNDSLVTWPPPSLNIMYFLCRRLVQRCEHSNFHDLACLLLVASVNLLYNHISMEVWKPYATREPVCPLEDFQWSGEPCFAVAAILIDCCLTQTPRRGKHKSLYSYWMLCGGSI